MIDKKNPAPLKRDDVRLAWVDLEMSGLDPDADVILEAAFIVTDADLNIVAESPSWAVRPPPGALDNMDKWNTKTHAKSGLAERCRAAEMDNDEVQREALKFLRKHAEHGRSPMCGNSVCQDRRFMARLMPKLESFFHYRNLDVSALKITAQMHNPKLAELKHADGKESAHRALDDIRDSIAEMRLYLDRLVVCADDVEGDYAECAKRREARSNKKKRRLQKKNARAAEKKARREANAKKRAAGGL